MRKLLSILLILIPISAQAALAPLPLATDQRIRQVMYNPNQVYDITATYGFQTAIEFSSQENIQVASIGDSIAWQVVPAGNQLFIKPITSDAMTNMTVITDQRSYYFKLLALESQDPATMTYLIRFNYPEPPPIFEGLSSGPKSPTDLNFNYKFKGDKNIGLAQAFDDGEFTYLQFQKMTDLPAIFLIGPDGRESLANFRIKEPYVIIERVGPELILRNGKSSIRLLNKAYASRGAVQA